MYEFFSQNGVFINEPRREKTCLLFFSDQVETNRTVQPLKMARHFGF